MEPAMSRILTLVCLVLLAGCAPAAPPPSKEGNVTPMETPRTRYAEVTLTADLSRLTDNERKMIPLLMEACDEMDAIFWQQAYGDRDALLAGIQDASLREFARINYGPWDRLQGNRPFLPGTGAKPAGAGYYPADMTKEEFEAAAAASPALKSPHTVVRRGSDGGLVAVPFHEAYAPHVIRAAETLRAAAALADDAGLRRYLEERARALLTDDYRPSDLAWLDMKTNGVDVVVGPIEDYEDQLFGLKTAHEGFVLIKDKEWSARLARYARLLPDLQRGLPVPDAYKREVPGSDSDLNAYDVVYYAGDCNAGSKTIAINLPNDEQVQLAKGTRRLQLKNAMRAKFDRILTPIAGRLIAPDQQGHVTFDAFFSNVMFHEVAHGLGIKTTVSGRGTVREALAEVSGPLEEGKADVLGLYMVTKLHETGELGEAPLMDNYVTFLAGIFRSVRFGAASAHGRANLAQFGFFEAQGAFTRDPATGAYRVNLDPMRKAVDALAGKILRLQGDGDAEGARRFVPAGGAMPPQLAADVQAIAAADIPTDVVFVQGRQVLGL
jgi:hypothetical protein